MLLKGPPNGAASSIWVKKLSLTSKPSQAAGVLAESGSLLFEGMLTYRDSKRVISITLDGYVTAQRCRLDGTVLPAPN